MQNPLDRIAATKAALRAIVIEHPQLVDAHRRFDLLAAGGRNLTCEHDGLSLIAPSFAGKSTIIRSYEQKRNDPERLRCRKVSVLHVTVPAKSTSRQLAEKLLARLGKLTGSDASPDDGTEKEKIARFIKFASMAELQLIALDEFHHAVSAKQVVIWNFAEAIKTLLIEGPCPIVMCGIDRARRPLQTNEQLRNRCVRPIELARLSRVSVSDAEYFTDFLCEYAAEVDARQIIGGAHLFVEEAPRLLEISRGLLGQACRFIEESIVVTLEAGRDKMRDDDLAVAADRFIEERRYNRNPFRDGIAPIQESAGAEALEDEVGAV